MSDKPKVEIMRVAKHYLVLGFLLAMSSNDANATMISLSVGTGGGGQTDTSGLSGSLTYTGAPADDPADIQTASATANINPNTGTLQASASGTYNGGMRSYGQGAANTWLDDSLTFDIPGATASTITYITVYYSVTGSGSLAGPAGTWDEEASLSIGNASWVQYAEDYAQGVPDAYQNAPVNWESAQVSNLSLNGADFVGIYALEGANPTVSIESYLGVGAAGGASGSFTSTLSLQLPDGVALTSGSLPVEAPSVPEPCTAILFSPALAWLVFRRRASSRTELA